MSVFADRLKELRLSRGENQSDVAKLLGVSVQSYSAYEGVREPKFDFVCKLAQHYNVSADYLLGLTDIKTTETNVTAICDYTGLSEKAVKTLASLNSWEYWSHISTINLLIEQEELSVAEVVPEMIYGWRGLTKEELLRYTAEDLQKLQKRNEDYEYFGARQKEWDSRPHIRIISKITDFFNAKASDKNYYFDDNGDVISEDEYKASPWLGPLPKMTSKDIVFTAYFQTIQNQLVAAKETYYSGESYFAKMRKKIKNAEYEESASSEEGEDNG
jgi:transcriptional regulator with XRE-family HTH domain